MSSNQSLVQRLIKKIQVLFSHDKLLKETKRHLYLVEDQAVLLFVNLIQQVKKHAPHLKETCEKLDTDSKNDYVNQQPIRYKLTELRRIITTLPEGAPSGQLAIQNIDKALMDLDHAMHSYQQNIPSNLCAQPTETPLPKLDHTMHALLDQQHKMEELSNQIYALRDAVMEKLKELNLAQLAAQLDRRMVGYRAAQIIPLLHEELSRRVEKNPQLLPLLAESERLSYATNLEQSITNSYYSKHNNPYQ